MGSLVSGTDQPFRECSRADSCQTASWQGTAQLVRRATKPSLSMATKCVTFLAAKHVRRSVLGVVSRGGGVATIAGHYLAGPDSCHRVLPPTGLSCTDTAAVAVGWIVLESSPCLLRR